MHFFISRIGDSGENLNFKSQNNKGQKELNEDQEDWLKSLVALQSSLAGNFKIPKINHYS